MIKQSKDVIHITTNKLSYLIGIRNGRYPENLYFGRKIQINGEIEALREKFANPYGNSVTTGEDAPQGNVTLDNLCLEFSNEGTGDYRIFPMELTLADGTFSTRFFYKEAVSYEGIYEKTEQTGMPHGRFKEREQTDTLELILEDETCGLRLSLIYTAFSESDVITRRTVLSNQGKEPVVLDKIMSLQLDLPTADYTLSTFDGLWARERHQNKKQLVSGIYMNESTNGTSSNRHNPFILLEKEGCGEDTGECLCTNLIYSGSHQETVEVSEYGKLRILSGIQPHGFHFTVAPGEAFFTPEAVLSYSSEGNNGLSANLHGFIRNHIMPPAFAYKERPILINNWEATYFNFNQMKLLGLAKEAGRLGMELFALDDGWFGNREDDTTSLGDWQVNERKLGCSLQELALKIKKEGLAFGLWMEPEMVSENSNLYRAHPDWAVTIPGRQAYLGRNQLLLDYSNPAVVEYMTATLTELLKSADISYVKWDMNRPFTDAYSHSNKEKCKEFYHRYILGLYQVFEKLTQTFPQILFEGCSAGGNRFDLGMLYYMPQIWTSDDTDAHERMMIQEGTSFGYPLNAMGAHVSASPNHQTLRNISLETRFQVACFGTLGYELDLTKLTLSEKKIMKQQVEFYKKYRRLFQTGTFSRGHLPDAGRTWQVTSQDQSQAVVLLYNDRANANRSNDILKVKHLKEDSIYHISARTCAISIKEFGNLVNQMSPVPVKEEGILQSMVNKVYTLESEKEEYTVRGSLLMYAGIKLKQRFIGTGYNKETRVMGDDSSRLYVIEEVKTE